MGILEEMQNELQELRRKIQTLETEVQALRKGSGDKHALAEYLGQSVGWVSKRADLPRYKVGRGFRYDFAKVEAYLENKAKEKNEKIVYNW